MPLLAGDVIDEARNAHPAFDKNRNPQKIVRTALSSYVGRLLGKINEIDETGLVLEQTQAMPLAVFANGITLTANRGVREIVAVDAQGKRYPIELIPAGQRNDRQTRVASAWIVNGVLYLNGIAATWNGISQIAISYTPLAGAIAADTDVLAAPDHARAAIVAALALFMARRYHVDKDGDLPPINIDDFKEEARTLELEFLEEVANSTSSQVFRVRDVWPGTV